MAKSLRIGIVGCGGIANSHLGAYQKQADVTVTAVYDVVKAAAEAFAAKAKAAVAGSLEDLAGKVDAVSICTPPAVHLDNARVFLERRIPILCEKPLEVDAGRAEQLAEAVRKAGSVFMTAYCHRFHPAVVELRRLIDAGTLGTPILFRNIFSGYLALKGNHRANPKLSGGGCIVDNGSHACDLFRYLAGEPTQVQAFIGTVGQELEVEDVGVIQLNAGGKVFGQIANSFSLPVGANVVEWFGSKGSAVVSYWMPGAPDLAYTLPGKSAVVVDCSKLPDRFTGEIAHFLECVRTGSQPRVTVYDGLQISRIVTAAYRSAREGGTVTVPAPMRA